MGSDPLAAVISSDYATLQVLLKAEEYKAAVVFAGSVEGLLLFALRAHGSPNPPSRTEIDQEPS
jgi:hypothetical protein